MVVGALHREGEPAGKLNIAINQGLQADLRGEYLLTSKY